MATNPDLGAGTTAPGQPTDVGVTTVDIGRHRVFSAAQIGSEVTIRRIGEGHDGLFIRWYAETTQRVTTRLRQLEAMGDPAAEAVAHELGRMLADHLDPAGRVVIGVPMNLGPLATNALLSGLSAGGIDASASDLVARPVAALAGWLAHRLELSGHVPRGPVLLIDNDGGEVSAVVAAPDEHRLIASAGLSAGPDDDAIEVETRLRALLARAASLTYRADDLDGRGIVQADDWATVSSTISQVVVTGSGAHHPRLQRLIAHLLPAADVMPDPIAPADRCVAAGLAHVAELEGWVSNWPTLTIVCRNQAGAETVVRSPGSLPTGNEESYGVAEAGSIHLRRGDDVVGLRAGSVTGSAISIPSGLGPMPVLKVLDDGRLLLLGPRGARPLAVRLDWPAPGDETATVNVEAIGRRAVSLVEASSDAPSSETS